MDETVKSLSKWFFRVGALDLFMASSRWLILLFLVKKPIILTISNAIYQVAWTVVILAFIYAGIALKKVPPGITVSRLWKIILSFGALVLIDFIIWRLPELLSGEGNTGFLNVLAFRLLVFGVIVYRLRRLSEKMGQENNELPTD